MMIKSRMRLNNNILFLIISVGCILQVASIAEGSILPFLDQMTSPGILLGETFLDPFRVLEHIPLALENRDDSLSLATAKVDWKETPEGHVITVDVPGLKKDDIKIEVEENRVLRVSGERKKEEEKKGEHWHCVERSYGKFWRQFRMPENADLDTIKAKLENGVLNISFAKLSPDRIKGPKVVAIDTKAEESQSSHPSIREEL